MAKGEMKDRTTFSPCVVSSTSTSRKLRVFLWGTSFLLGVACIVGFALRHPISVEESDTDEIMKPWEDGIYPARAHFPPGYKFGDDNTFGEGDTFAAGDKFGSGNTFGKNNRFGAGDIIEDSNTFGKGASFAAGVEVGNKNIISDDATFASGDVIGNDNQMGKGVRFGKRVSIGHDNFFGIYNEFGRRDQFGARNMFGRGTIFGGDANFGKEQQFGSDITWDTTRDNENFQGEDLFGYRDWGLDVDAIPESDKEGWLSMAAKDPDYVPERETQIKVMSLKGRPAAAASGVAVPRPLARAAAAAAASSAQMAASQPPAAAAAMKPSAAAAGGALLDAVRAANAEAASIGARLRGLTQEMRRAAPPAAAAGRG